MRCDLTRLGLDAAFDAGTPLPEALSQHLEHCPACARYQRALASIDYDLLAEPAPPVPKDLTERVKFSVAQEQPHQRVPMSVRWVTGALLCVSAAVTGWFYPLPWDVRLWWGQADAWHDPEAWRALLAQLASPVLDTWQSIVALLAESTSALSPTLLWGGVAVGTLVLVLFNALEARFLDTGSRGRSSRQARG